MDIGRLFLATVISTVWFASSAFAQLDGAPVKDAPKDCPSFVISAAEVMEVTLVAETGDTRVVNVSRPVRRVPLHSSEEPKQDRRAVVSVTIGTRKTLDWQAFRLDHENKPIAVQLCGITIFAGDCPPLNDVQATSFFRVQFPNLAEALLFMQKFATATK